MRAVILASMPIFYQRKSASSLLDLKSGDHIQVENTAQDPGWAKWAVSKTRDYLFDQTTNTVEPGHHMMAVRPVNNDRVRVIYLDKKGVKEEDVTFNAGNVIVLAYESPVNGDGLLKMPEKALILLMTHSIAPMNSLSSTLGVYPVKPKLQLLQILHLKAPLGKSEPSMSCKWETTFVRKVTLHVICW